MLVRFLVKSEPVLSINDFQGAIPQKEELVEIYESTGKQVLEYKVVEVRHKLNANGVRNIDVTIEATGVLLNHQVP